MPSITVTNSGSGPQNVTTGDGTQYNNNGLGNQYNNTAIHSDRRISAPSPSIRSGNKLGSICGGPSDRSGFSVAVVCALSLEYDAVSLLLDETWDEEVKSYGRAPGDSNTYTFGRIGQHNVVLVLLPNMGSSIAAGSAASLRSSFSGLRLALLVGICGGVPGTGPDERLLGDVVISKTIYHNIGKKYPSAFVVKDTANDALGRPNNNIRSLVAIFETEAGEQKLRKKAGLYLGKLRARATH
ncbi:adenosylhomocysteine nucleosidase [Microdochium nivale]|nr:adenosylhomocysteine nucleosidase [Microdochium nivale]